MRHTAIFQPVMVPSPPLFLFLLTILRHTSCLSTNNGVASRVRGLLRVYPSQPHSSSHLPLSFRSPLPGCGVSLRVNRTQVTASSARCRPPLGLHHPPPPAPPSSSVSLPLTSSPSLLYPSTPSVHADYSICHPNPPSLPTLPVLRYLPLPLSSPLSSLSITLSVIDGGAGRQPGKKVLRICPFRRLLPVSRPSCLSARPRRCSSYLFPCKPPLSPPAVTLPSLRVSRARPEWQP